MAFKNGRIRSACFQAISWGNAEGRLDRKGN